MGKSSIYFAFLAAGALAGGCSKGTARDLCDAGFVTRGDGCAQICDVSEQCTNNQACDRGICVPTDVPLGCEDTAECPLDYECLNRICTPENTGEGPQITNVYGDGPAQEIERSINIQGVNLLPSTVTLESTTRSVSYALNDCSDSTPTLLHMSLPDDLIADDYNLTVVNQGQSCAQPLQMLRGSDDTATDIITKLDAARLPVPPEIPQGVLGGLVSTLTARSDGTGRSIKLNGRELIADDTDEGIFVAIIDRDTHTELTINIPITNGSPLPPNRSYGNFNTDVGNLARLLDVIDDSNIVVLASKGTVDVMHDLKVPPQPPHLDPYLPCVEDTDCSSNALFPKCVEASVCSDGVNLDTTNKLKCEEATQATDCTTGGFADCIITKVCAEAPALPQTLKNLGATAVVDTLSTEHWVLIGIPGVGGLEAVSTGLASVGTILLDSAVMGLNAQTLLP